jgi:hypothetical protein
MKRISVAIALALCVALPASAQMYKWVDSNGKVHYSDKPPPGNVKTETLREAPRPASAPAATEAKGEAKKDAAKGETKADAPKAGPRTPAEQEQAFRKRQAEAAKAQEEAAKKDAEARQRAENCRRAKAALASLELGGRQTRIDEKGERVYLSDQQVSQETAKARQDAAEVCK